MTRSTPFPINPIIKDYDTLSSDSSIKWSSRVLTTSADNPNLPELALVLSVGELRDDLFDDFPGKHERKYIQIMTLQVYSNCCIDVVFGEGLLDFSVGQNADGFPIVQDFIRNEGGSFRPLEVERVRMQ